MVTSVHEEIKYCSPITSSRKPKKNRPTINRNSAVNLPLRRLKQTNFCWPFSSLQKTASLQIFIAISTKYPNSKNRSPQRCPCLTENLKSLSSLKTFSKWASKFLFSWLKMTESTISTLVCGKMRRYKLLKVWTVQPERIWEKSRSFAKEVCETPIHGDSEL